MRLTALAIALILPAAALAVGSDDDTPPQPTSTTQDCADGQVWDEATKACVAPTDSRLDDDDLYRAVREFAYVGDYGAAEAALAAMSDQEADRVLTYRGFLARKQGRTEEAMDFYAAALARNPDNLLARSYRGQAFVEGGDLLLARADLTEIRRRGGRGTWPEVALRMAIDSGRTSSY